MKHVKGYEVMNDLNIWKSIAGKRITAMRMIGENILERIDLELDNNTVIRFEIVDYGTDSYEPDLRLDICTYPAPPPPPPEWLRLENDNESN